MEAVRLQVGYCRRVAAITQELGDFTSGMFPLAAGLMRHAAAMQEHVANSVQPFNIAVFGRMKAGKSSLINALIGCRLVITGVEEATATINRLIYASGKEQLDSFKVHWREGPPETFPLGDLASKWNGKRDDVMERVSRVKFLDLYSDALWLRDVQVIDTPGTGSTVEEHEEAAQQFINAREADALIYVFNPVARESDAKDLQSFRDHCLPGSGPYNSVAVMHKWDEVYWNNGGDFAEIKDKAGRLCGQMQNLVSTVVPVSAPLALVSQLADETFWQGVFCVLSAFSTENELNASLAATRVWNLIPSQKGLYVKAHGDYDMPWASFRVMLRELYRRRCRDTESAAQIISELSGIGNLRSILEHHFLKRSAIIRLRRTRTLVKADYDRVIDLVVEARQVAEEEISQLQKISNAINDTGMRNWLQGRSNETSTWLNKLEQVSVKIDRDAIATEEEVQRLDNALELVPWIEGRAQAYLSPRQMELVLATLESGASIPDEDREGLNRDINSMLNDMNPETRTNAKKILDILWQSFQS